MLEKEIAKYLENHYLKFYKIKVKLHVTHLVDRGYYYQFNLWQDNVVRVGETIMKLDLELNQGI